MPDSEIRKYKWWMEVLLLLRRAFLLSIVGGIISGLLVTWFDNKDVTLATHMYTISIVTLMHAIMMPILYSIYMIFISMFSALWEYVKCSGTLSLREDRKQAYSRAYWQSWDNEGVATLYFVTIVFGPVLILILKRT